MSSNCFRVSIAAGLLLMTALSSLSPAVAQEQTTQQLPLPTGQAQTQSADKRWQVTLDSAWNSFSTTTTSPTVAGWSKSVTNYFPVGMQFVGIPNDALKIEFGLRSGYLDVRQRSSSAADFGYSGWTDTSINTTLIYYGFDGFQPFASLAANLPTGQSNIVSATVKTPADSDVTQISGLGEGFNLGPTLGVNVPITKDLLATLSAGYTSRGNFIRSGVNAIFINQPGFGPLQDIKPGDVTTVSAAIGYQSGAWSFQASSSFSYEGVTTVDGANFYQTGGRYALSAGLGYAWNEAWSSKISSSFSHTGKNRYPLAPAAGNFQLAQEFFNTNSDAVSVAFDTTYRAGAFAIGPTASYLYRDHNGYDSDTAQFLSAKTKWTAGAAGQYAANDMVSLNARAERLWMTTNAGPFAPLPGVPQFNIDGWIISVGGKAQF